MAQTFIPVHFHPLGIKSERQYFHMHNLNTAGQYYQCIFAFVICWLIFLLLIVKYCLVSHLLFTLSFEKNWHHWSTKINKKHFFLLVIDTIWIESITRKYMSKVFKFTLWKWRNRMSSPSAKSHHRNFWTNDAI